MKVAVLGASGFVGSYVLQILRRSQVESVGTFFQHSGAGLVRLDCGDYGAMESFVREGKYDSIIVLASQPNVEWCESHPDESYARNTLPISHLAKILTKVNSSGNPNVIFVSSDYVFDGFNGPYTEEDRPNPLSVYGRHKLEAEKITLALEGTVVRITVVYGLEKNQKNFAERLIREAKQKRKVMVPVDQIGSPTYVEDVARALAEVAARQLRGIYHVAGPDCISRYELALRIAEVMQLDPAYIVPVQTAELGQKAKRPLRAGMLSGKFESTVGWKLQGIEQGLSKMQEQISKTQSAGFGIKVTGLTSE
ncbi:MAG: SDR family oxidoreductase [Desulfitobacterium hafniense]|nr:SDR family oxidoreductase [Desulfitobacterium hafniense]